eukprot:11213598-Lingulodinium_polyedra.AAC.1
MQDGFRPGHTDCSQTKLLQLIDGRACENLRLGKTPLNQIIDKPRAPRMVAGDLQLPTAG